MLSLKDILQNDEIKEAGGNVLVDLTSALKDGDVMVLGNLVVEFSRNPYFIRDAIFWQNFKDYLLNVCVDDERLRKLSAKLAEDGDAQENAKRIIKIIDDVGTKKKAIYISNLTRACCMELIDINKFFKLSQCITRLTDEDLQFLATNISTNIIDTDEEYIDDFRNCGLLKEVDGGFSYTRRAYELKNYSLSYDETVNIPELPSRQMIGSIDNEDIEKLFVEKTSELKTQWVDFKENIQQNEQ